VIVVVAVRNRARERGEPYLDWMAWYAYLEVLTGNVGTSSSGVTLASGQEATVRPRDRSSVGELFAIIGR